MRFHHFALVPLILASPALAAEVQIAVDGPVVEIGVSEMVQSAPDRATVSAGVTARAQTAVDAMRQNAEAMDRVIARLRSAGIAREDIQTSGINLNPQYRYDNDAVPTFLGYDAMNTVSVTLKDLDRIGSTIDALVAAGATNIGGPFFRREDDGEIRRVARKAAFARAQARADEYARLAGYGGVRLLEINETVEQRGPIPFDAMAPQAVAETSAKVTPVEPGRVGTVVQMTVKYEMTR